MSIKDLFKDRDSISNLSSEEINSNIESREFINEKTKENFEFIPDLDFATASNFARFGLAQDYYEQAVRHIYNSYPYDGSEKETIEWKNKLSFLEKYVLDEEYPKTAGYLHLNSGSFIGATVSSLTGSGIKIASSSLGQTVKFFSGPNGSDYKNGNIYSLADSRGANLEISYVPGNTIEFWYKADSSMPEPIKSASAAIFDLWNGQTNTSSLNYSRFLIDITPSSGSFRFTYKNGIEGIERKEFLTTASELYNWHHYAFSVKNLNDKLNIKFYVDGQLRSETTDGTDITNINLKNLVANIGSYRFTPKEGEAAFSSVENYGQLQGYIDEFRYWKTERTQKEIFKFRFDRVYGGTNTDLSNTELGVYYRFNEGITLNSSIDSTVLDYSGRVSNATIINYRANTRVTSSAIDESGLFANIEPKDPIIYSNNSLVSSLLQTLSQRGEEWDKQNGNAIFKTLPEWITTEDEEKSSGELRKLTQIIASYFDKLYLQIKFLPTFNFSDYPKEEKKPVPFMNTILESNGMVAPEIFIDSNIFENIKNRNDERIFEEKLFDLKNLIYKNIYNNLTYIYKSKGTEKSFRNLIRCFGIDDEIIKLNVYANNTEFTLENNKKSFIAKKRVVNLSTPDSFYTNIYNTQDTDGSSYGNSYIEKTINSSTGPVPYYVVPLTFETNLSFPKKPPLFLESYAAPESAEISLFGSYTVSSSVTQTNYSTIKNQGYYNFEVTFVKNKKDDTGGYFKFNSILTNEVLTSSYYSDVYDDENWTFAVRLKTPYKNLDILSYNPAYLNAGPTTGNYVLEFYGVNTQENIVKNEFTITSSAIPIAHVKNIHNKEKRFYIGAKRENMTGSLEKPTDILVSSAKFWFDYITDEEIKEHAKDPMNVGVASPLEKPYKSLGESIERINTLGFYWDFAQVTSSDSNGKAYIKDIKSVSDVLDSNFAFNVEKRHPATIDNTIANYTDIVKYKYDLIASRNQIPENLYSTETVNIFGESDTIYNRNVRPINLFWSFEKSMYQIISEDILSIFAGILDFNTLIGAPVNKYRLEYRDLNAIREKYFSKVQNSPSLERFVEYYKWIDSSIGAIIGQISPASTDISQNIRTMVESHALERSKIAYKIPIFSRDEKNYGQIKGIKEIKYNWRIGHAPEPQDLSTITTQATQAKYSLWLKERGERTNTEVFTVGSTEQALDRQTMLNSINNETNAKEVNLFNKANSNIYKKTTYFDRKLARVVDVTGSVARVINGIIRDVRVVEGGKIIVR